MVLIARGTARLKYLTGTVLSIFDIFLFAADPEVFLKLNKSSLAKITAIEWLKYVRIRRIAFKLTGKSTSRIPLKLTEG